ncbi:hypothetical protein P153DRAFT_334207 [Dothidotthia symphoricarpi CBS 119687]|uniref:Arb2 domain-containing protein n=1 Tax=Dothidotthia symphoricarpi CBS 119687 TaxID=1392245 RepID=A0A6A6ALE8_9PLEO|nr:uncharacterized protein P153DRAFT_334207 [Dothidotthia symphoricarpi CBS 119687]KAF2131905.1 hypothetical protein P153DRAFT_334207 [Dothidotthia symphoricarpi CBS 119687]
MFRRIENSIEPDPSFPANLKALGFFVNDVGNIRMIEAPDKEYIFHATNNDRVNEVRREAMQACSREEVGLRLSALGIRHIYLPNFTTVKPDGPHIPILAPPPEVLKSRKRIIVLINDSTQDLGILAYRQLQRELGVNGGSIVNLVKEIIKRSADNDDTAKFEHISTDGYDTVDDGDVPGLVVLNTGQLLYSHKFNQAMTLRSWSALPRKSVAHDAIRIHDEENRVKGHTNPQEHIKSVFDEVLCNPDRVAPDAEVYVLAIEGGTDDVLDILAENFEKYGSRITAMALIHSLIDESQITNPQLKALLHQRTRQWKYSDITCDPTHCTELPAGYDENKTDSPPHDASPPDEHVSWHENVPAGPRPISGITKALHRLALTVTPSKTDKPTTATPTDTYSAWPDTSSVVSPTFGGGSNSVGECVLTNPAVQHAILSFFESVAQNPEHYRNPLFRLHTTAPQPTPDNPLVLSADDATSMDFHSLPAATTPEQQELDTAREILAEMRDALAACPMNVAELAPGREKLAKRIQDKERAIEVLETTALASGGLRAGEALEKRQNWTTLTEGPKVPFAGTMVDSELLKAVGLGGTVEEELGKLEKD